MIKISVLVPVYNVEKYLKQCLDSILQQTLKEIEIICIDDGSTDQSVKILDDYASSDNRIKVLHKKNTGYGDSMNKAIDMAQGEYIGIVESDDFIEKEMYERLYYTAKEYDLDFIKAEYYRYSEHQKMKMNDYSKSIYQQVFASYEKMEKFNNTTMSIWSGIYKTSFLKSNNIRFLPSPGASYQDISFMFKVYVCAQRSYILDEAYVNYRVDNEASSVKSKGKVYCVCDEIAECKKFLNNRSDKAIYMPYLVKVMFYVYRWNIRRLSMSSWNGFISFISAELKKDKEGDYFKEEIFSKEERLEYLLLSDYPENYIQYKLLKEINAETNNNKIYEEGYVKKLESYSDIYIYGAGKIGKRLEAYIKRINKDSKIRYVVSDKGYDSQDNCLEINDRLLNINYPVFIAVNNIYDKAEMICKAKNQGFQEIICVDETLMKLI